MRPHSANIVVDGSINEVPKIYIRLCAKILNIYPSTLLITESASFATLQKPARTQL